MKVLIAEDDRAVRESLARAMHLEGYEVETVADGAAALESVRSLAPDIVVLDVSMPHVDGLTVCRVLRSEGKRVPILMLTARTETSDRVAGLDAGADDYVPKPFDLDELSRPGDRVAREGDLVARDLHELHRGLGAALLRAAVVLARARVMVGLRVMAGLLAAEAVPSPSPSPEP